jgi:uridine kinase
MRCGLFTIFCGILLPQFLMKRQEAFEFIKTRTVELTGLKGKPVRLAINGIEGSGKTSFAVELVRYLVQEGIDAIHVSIDGFHRPKQYRYRQGRDSARGYYEDAYDEAAFVEKVLVSSQEQNPHYFSAIHDLDSDEQVQLLPTSLAPNSVLVTDGAYLFKLTYEPYWDLKIYLKVPFELAKERGVNRDMSQLGGRENAENKYAARYHAASQIYIEECKPEAIADIVFDNSVKVAAIRITHLVRMN